MSARALMVLIAVLLAACSAQEPRLSARTEADLAMSVVRMQAAHGERSDVADLVAEAVATIEADQGLRPVWTPSYQVLHGWTLADIEAFLQLPAVRIGPGPDQGSERMAANDSNLRPGS